MKKGVVSEFLATVILEGDAVMHNKFDFDVWWLSEQARVEVKEIRTTSLKYRPNPHVNLSHNANKYDYCMLFVYEDNILLKVYLIPEAEISNSGSNHITYPHNVEDFKYKQFEYDARFAKGIDTTSYMYYD